MTAQSKQVGPRGRLAFQPRAASRRRAFRNPHYSRKIPFRDLPRKGGFLMRSTPYIYSWTKRPLQPPAAPAGKIPLNQRLAVAFQKPFRILRGGRPNNGVKPQRNRDGKGAASAGSIAELARKWENYTILDDCACGADDVAVPAKVQICTFSNDG